MLAGSNSRFTSSKGKRKLKRMSTNLLDSVLDDSPILEHVVIDSLSTTVGGQIVVLSVLDEKDVCMTSSRHVRAERGER